jgi:hypothetical protein
MSKTLLKTEFDMASLARQIKKSASKLGESQDQAVKRWGVQTCRDLAVFTQSFGKKAAIQKMSMMADGRRVIFTHEGSAKPSKTGKSMIYTHNGKKGGAPMDRYLKSEEEVMKWINQNRTGSHKRTVKMPPESRATCSEALFKRSINKKHRETSGMAKDGWLDAGDSISRGQKGKQPMRIGAGFMKWARKPAKLGVAKEGRRGFKSFGNLINKLPYVSTRYVLSGTNKNKAIRSGALKTLKWYRKTIKANAKKKK